MVPLPTGMDDRLACHEREKLAKKSKTNLEKIGDALPVSIDAP